MMALMVAYLLAGIFKDWTLPDCPLISRSAMSTGRSSRKGRHQDTGEL
jgi:hypothetical protein